MHRKDLRCDYSNFIFFQKFRVTDLFYKSAFMTKTTAVFHMSGNFISYICYGWCDEN